MLLGFMHQLKHCVYSVLADTGADPSIVKAMAEAAKKSSHDGHDSNAHLVDAVAALQKHGHDEAKEEHHSGGLFGLFGH